MSDEERPVEMEVHQGVMRPGWYWWAAMLASSVVFSAIAVAVSLHAQAESEQKWCRIVSSLDSAYNQQPPRTELGKRIARDMHDLRRSLDCPKSTT